MSACATQFRDLKDATVETFDELEIEYYDGRIHNAFEACVDGEDIVLLCGYGDHVDAVQGGDAVVSATYLGLGSGGYPRYLVTRAAAL